MNMKTLFLLAYLAVCVSRSEKCAATEDTLYYILEPGKTLSCCEQNEYENQPIVFCYTAVNTTLQRLWSSSMINTSLTYGSYSTYIGKNSSVVMEKYEQGKRHFSLYNFLRRWKQQIHIDPFHSTCIAIETFENYDISLIQREFDYSLFSVFLSGLLLFLCARQLSQWQIFYYLLGSALGVVTSVVIILYWVHRSVANVNRPLFYTMLGGTWTLSWYFANLIFENVHRLLNRYKEYFMTYVAFFGIAGFILAYRFGSVTDKRTRTIVYHALQICGLCLMYLSSYMVGEMVLVICVVLFLRLFGGGAFTTTGRVFAKIRSYLKGRRYYKPEVRLLTQEEFNQQGIVETAKALENLRKYCHSPDVNAWKVVSKLKNPAKFASFVEGGSHVSDDEVNEYETTVLTNVYEEDISDE